MMTMLKVAKLARFDNQMLRAFDQRWTLGLRNDLRNHPVPDILNELVTLLLCLAGFSLVVPAVFMFMKLYGDPTNPGIFSSVVFLVTLIVFISQRAKHVWSKIHNRKGAHEFMAIISLMESIYKKAKLTDNMWEWDQWNAADSGKAITTYLRSQAKELQRLEMISWRKDEEKSLRERFDWELDKLSRITLIPSARDRYFVRDDEESDGEPHSVVDLAQYKSVATSK